MSVADITISALGDAQGGKAAIGTVETQLAAFKLSDIALDQANFTGVSTSQATTNRSAALSSLKTLVAALT